MKQRIVIVMACLLLAGAQHSAAQSLLGKNISLDVNRQRLDQVLEILSNKGNFYFSYNSMIIKRDSIVSLSARNKTVKDILSLLFNQTYEFRESGNYIIIRKAPIRMTLVTNKAAIEERVYSVTGFVYDEQSGGAIHEASVYEKKLLASALTNEQGFFKLKLKSSKASTVALTVSKEFYEDTTVTIEPRHSQQLTITMMPLEPESATVIISPEDYLVQVQEPEPKPEVKDTVTKLPLIPRADSVKVDRTGMGRFLLSAKSKIQSINLRKFFTTRPFQFSLVPGIGSHGYMSGQVVNNFSLNLIGGYTAGTKGLEIGGVFNIDKKDVKYVQVAGVFNLVGGKVKGVQIAGVNNTVLDSVKAVQTAGVNNLVKGKFSGLQIAGVYNHVTDTVKGMQTGGVANFARKKATGVQIAGVVNYAKEMRGVQVAGVVNYTKKLRGLQIGVINIADTSEGYSIGLINIVMKGYHKLSFFTNEVVNFNAAFKTGNAKLYSILQAGMNWDNNKKAYSFGYGLGSERMLNKSRTLSLNPELSSQYFYLGSWDYTNLLNRLQVNLTVRFGKYFSIFGGPAYSVLISDQKTAVNGYRYPVVPAGYKPHEFSNKVSGWLGWNIGINFF